MAAKEKEKNVTVVAKLAVTSSEGEEIVKSFASAWVRALELPRPVHISFRGFVRKD